MDLVQPLKKGHTQGGEVRVVRGVVIRARVQQTLMNPQAPMAAQLLFVVGQPVRQSGALLPQHVPRGTCGIGEGNRCLH